MAPTGDEEEENKDLIEDSQEETESNGVAKRKRERTNSNDSASDAAEEQTKKSKAIEETSEVPVSPPQVAAAYGYGSYESVAPSYGVPVNAATNGSDVNEPLIMELPPDKVGQVIGSKGAIIQEVQTRSGAKAHVNQDFPDGVNRQISLTGTPQQVKAAAELIRSILEQGPQAIHINAPAGSQITTILECTQDQVGKVIGTKGATIKELQSKSGCRIQIDQDFPPDQPRKINITGTASACAIAAQLINTVMTQGAAAAGLSGGSGGFGGGGFGGNPGSSFGYGGGNPYGQPQANPYGGGMGMGQPHMGHMGMPQQQQPYGGGAAGGETKKVLDVPKSIVGKLIGRGGETITMIQRKSGCRVQVDQNVPEGVPCHIQMTGSAQSVQAAMDLIRETMMQSREGESIIQQMVGQFTLNGPPGGGMMPMQNYGMAPSMQQQPYGMPAAYGMPPMQQMPQQYGAYGGYPGQGAPMQQYGQPQPQYGMPQPAVSNGYQAYGAAPGGAMPAAVAYGAPQQQYAQPAPVAKPAPAAVVWTEHKTDDGITYWYNATTGVSQWERPKGF